MADTLSERGKKALGLRGQVRREWKRRTYFFFAMVFCAFGLLSYSLLFGDMGLIKYIELRQNKARLEQEISRLEKENKTLSQQVDSLKKDPYYIEKYAREEYGLAKPDEVIFQFKKNTQQE
jgi:cell division protein FtsB